MWRNWNTNFSKAINVYNDIVTIYFANVCNYFAIFESFVCVCVWEPTFLLKFDGKRFETEKKESNEKRHWEMLDWSKTQQFIKGSFIAVSDAIKVWAHKKQTVVWYLFIWRDTIYLKRWPSCSKYPIKTALKTCRPRIKKNVDCLWFEQRTKEQKKKHRSEWHDAPARCAHESSPNEMWLC